MNMSCNKPYLIRFPLFYGNFSTIGTDRRSDGRTDGRTDGRMNKAPYRDAWMHLKTFLSPNEKEKSFVFRITCNIFGNFARQNRVGPVIDAVSGSGRRRSGRRVGRIAEILEMNVVGETGSGNDNVGGMLRIDQNVVRLLILLAFGSMVRSGR